MAKKLKKKLKKKAKSNKVRVLKETLEPAYPKGLPKKILNFHLPVGVIADFHDMANKYAQGNKTRFLLAAMKHFRPSPDDFTWVEPKAKKPKD